MLKPEAIKSNFSPHLLLPLMNLVDNIRDVGIDFAGEFYILIV